MRLAVDASPLLTPFTGIAHYTRELMQRIMQAPDIEVHFCYGFYWGRSLRGVPVPYFDRVLRTIRATVPRVRGSYRATRQLVFSAGVRRRHIELYHAPNFLPLRFGGPTVITVHDLSYLRYPETHPRDRVAALERELPHAVQNAAYVLVDSNFVREEVLSTFAIDPAKVVTTHLGVSDVFRPRSAADTAHILSPLGLQSARYILSVGTLEPRKNLLGTLEAYEGLPDKVRKTYPLVLAGAAGWRLEGISQRLARMVSAGDVKVLGYVPQTDLPALYAGAAAFVYPSVYEGFGLPVLEALASGVPVVTSNRSSLVEVAGDAALTVNPDDTSAIRQALLSLLEDSRERAGRVARGLEWARTFTWERCAEQTISVYRRAMP